MNILFLMDPLETVDPTHDTTFALMIAATEAGHKTYYLEKNGISKTLNDYRFHVIEVIADPHMSPPFRIKDTKRLYDTDVDAILIRTDPPFDSIYLAHTWLLDDLSQRVFIMNHPSGIRNANEKLWATQFRDLVPKTLVTSRKSEYLNMLNTEKKLILKPIDSFGGQSIFMVSEKDPNKNTIFETLSQNERMPIIVQEYLDDAKHGDKRILLLNGEPLGAVLRKHSKDDHRNNMFAGGSFEKSTLNDRDIDIVQRLKPHLVRERLTFVGIDVIGDYLIEVNVTSPTCLQELSHLDKKDIAGNVLQFIEKQAAHHR